MHLSDIIWDRICRMPDGYRFVSADFVGTETPTGEPASIRAVAKVMTILLDSGRIKVAQKVKNSHFIYTKGDGREDPANVRNSGLDDGARDDLESVNERPVRVDVEGRPGVQRVVFGRWRNTGHRANVNIQRGGGSSLTRIA